MVADDPMEVDVSSQKIDEDFQFDEEKVSTVHLFLWKFLVYVYCFY